MERTNRSVEGAVEDPRERWTKETRAAIEFEEDPHKAALMDNPSLVYVGGRTWAAIFALSLSLAAPIGLAFVSLASVVAEVTKELDGQELLPWVVGSWSVAGACSAAVGGYLGDTFGRRNVIILGDLIVLLGSLLGGTARSIEILISAQALIGLGTGFAFDAFAAVPEMLPNKWRALGAGIVEGGINVPWATISVVLANALAQYASWRWIYYISILLSFITFKATALLYWPTSRPRGDFHKTRRQQIKELDYIGILSITSGIVIMVCALTWGGVMYPWSSPGSIIPLVIGVVTLVAGFIYDWTLAENPLAPWNLFRPKTMFRPYVSLLCVLFISGMNFYAMSALLPLGSALMFTTDGIQIGCMSLPNTVMQLIVGFIFPVIAHKIPDYIPCLTIKWQLVVGATMQAIFLAVSAASVNPNNYYAYILLPALGVPMFVWVTVLSYAIASLHVPHSQLGTALGFLGTFRSTGGAVGNAFFQWIFRTTSQTYTLENIQAACQNLGICPNTTAVNTLLADTIAYNSGTPDRLGNFTPEIRDTLQKALRGGYGHSFQVVFAATVPLSLVALICALWIEDPTPYMNNHVQFRMYEKGGFGFRGPESPALTGATVISSPSSRKIGSKDMDGNGVELGQVRSQSSHARLNPDTRTL